MADVVVLVITILVIAIIAVVSFVFFGSSSPKSSAETSSKDVKNVRDGEKKLTSQHKGKPSGRGKHVGHTDKVGKGSETSVLLTSG